MKKLSLINRPFRNGIVMLVAGVLTLTSCSKEQLENTLSQQESVEISDLNAAQLVSGEKYVANELLVKFKKGIPASVKQNVFLKMNAKVKEHIHTNAMKNNGDEEGVFLVNMSKNALEVLQSLNKMNEIEYAELNYIYNHYANETNYTNGNLWGMYSSTTTPKNDFGSGAAAVWAKNKTGATGSSDVYIGIIDEGYMYTHEDLAANAGVNPGEIAGNRIDDDRNGLVDDVYGWDFAGNNNTIFDGVGDDHGTHVAGTIGAVGNNSRGVVGVCWNVKMIGAKFLGSTGGTTANAIKAVDYFTNLKTRQTNPVNIIATNNSWGGGGFSQALNDAIDRADAAGILFIAAAGNSATNNDVTASYPSGYSSSNIIAVASITSTGGLSSFSQYGATSVDIGAPGSAILSCVPVKSGKKVVSGYASYNGTSMATPHVTGAVALYKSINPSATASQIKTAIMNAATATTSLSGKCVSGGRLNVSGF
jgi:subtilisin family serine protease